MRLFLGKLRHKIMWPLMFFGLAVPANVLIFFGVRIKPPSLRKENFIVTIVVSGWECSAFIASYGCFFCRWKHGFIIWICKQERHHTTRFALLQIYDLLKGASWTPFRLHCQTRPFWTCKCEWMWTAQIRRECGTAVRAALMLSFSYTPIVFYSFMKEPRTVIVLWVHPNPKCFKTNKPAIYTGLLMRVFANNQFPPRMTFFRF